MDLYWAQSPKMRKAGVIASFPRMVCYKMVGLDTGLVWTYLGLAHIVGDAHRERLHLPPQLFPVGSQEDEWICHSVQPLSVRA